MKKFTVIVATDANMDLSKVLINGDKPVPVLNNFQLNQPPLGVGRLFKEKGVIKCEIVLRPDMQESEAVPFLTPAIGGKFVKSTTSNYCLSGLVAHVSLGSNPNVDPNVLPIYKQLNLPLIQQP